MYFESYAHARELNIQSHTAKLVTLAHNRSSSHLLSHLPHTYPVTPLLTGTSNIGGGVLFSDRSIRYMASSDLRLARRFSVRWQERLTSNVDSLILRLVNGVQLKKISVNPLGPEKFALGRRPADRLQGPETPGEARRGGNPNHKSYHK
ncbi:hypothetical protein NQ318_012885 [Aromia moschata]|uniref:Uncharacterized protein n=1 Tax=Aromia moschata TaxID=1265417 RepID=A0AAV8YDA1_9CUCU|nr:hypothetical protein NQ318_012885 [Aromia moschata]